MKAENGIIHENTHRISSICAIIGSGGKCSYCVIQQGELITELYCKKIMSNRLLNFNLCHLKNMILNVAKAFMRHECIPTATEILAKNSFSSKIIDTIWYSHNHQTPDKVMLCFHGLRKSNLN